MTNTKSTKRALVLSVLALFLCFALLLGTTYAWFTDSVIKLISDQKEHVVFILWGGNARSKKPLIDTSKHLILECAHPSPLSAYNGFFGCKHFSKTNAYLESQGLKPIDWDLTK